MATEVELALMAYGVYGLSDKNKIDLGSWAVHAPSLAQTDGSPALGTPMATKWWLLFAARIRTRTRTFLLIS